MGLSATAELLADGGAAAVSDDFFRSRAFLEAEGVTHTLRLAGDRREALVPLIVREVEGTEPGRRDLALRLPGRHRRGRRRGSGRERASTGRRPGW